MKTTKCDCRTCVLVLFDRHIWGVFLQSFLLNMGIVDGKDNLALHPLMWPDSRGSGVSSAF